MAGENEIHEQFARRETKRGVKMVMKIIMFIIFAVLAVFVVGEIVHLLWNALMPAIFHLSVISYWQALGLMILSWFLFGGMRGMARRGPGFRGRWGMRMHQRWEQMTPEEREKFRGWMQSRCGPFAGGEPPKA